MTSHIKRHPDRVSVSFAEEGPDVDWIITVTFDNLVVQTMNDDAITVMAHERLFAFTSGTQPTAGD